MKQLQKALLSALSMLAVVGCGAPASDEPSPSLNDGLGHVVQLSSASDGRDLFTKEKFDGNGRTCSTCHTLATGTLSPADIAARSSTDPIFRALDSDDGSGASYSKLKNDATVTVTINLPANIRLAATPTVRSVTLRRGIPSTIDAPSLDPVIMLDGREPTLQNQASDAVMGHAQAKQKPSSDQLDSIALFEKTLFSSSAMQAYASGGSVPALPAGNTDSEKRGRAFFDATGVCGSCHNGALLNTMTANNPQGFPAGTRYSSAGVSEFNFAGNPTLEYIVTNPDGTETHVVSPDPGRMLITGNAADANFFKMLSLRNLKNTAPYFHDNSAKTIEQVVSQYKALFSVLGVPLTEQDWADITAYLYLL